MSARRPDTAQEQCGGCGSLGFERARREGSPLLRECPHCGADKCLMCDMGDDVECGNCDTGEPE